MLHSQIDNEIGKQEFELMEQQEHVEEVWLGIKPQIKRYIDQYLDTILCEGTTESKLRNYLSMWEYLIDSNRPIKEKYEKLFEEEIMDEYEGDLDSFKGVILKKECEVIRKTWNSKSEALKDWKIEFNRSKPSELYDTFFNFLEYGRDYEKKTDEDRMGKIDTFDEIGLKDMRGEYNCFLVGVIGTGIVSNILNHMYPRVFPGNFKIGMFTLYLLTNNSRFGMASNTSEFLMIKDDIKSNTGTIEAEHNYYYPYHVFALLTLRLFRMLKENINGRLSIEVDACYRYLLTNDFYLFVFDANKEAIKALTGNDDILKFSATF